jgi:CRISPR-associated protein Csh1
MLKKEFLGDNMLDKENINSLKEIFGEELTEETNTKIDEIIENDPACKYFLIGQFIRLIDITKFSNDKKTIFNNFIGNLNRNNIRKLFVTEILQKNNFYIEKMNKKGKYIFKILENDLDSIFNEEYDFDYEDYLLLLFTGYYTTNILRGNYTFKGDE